MIVLLKAGVVPLTWVDYCTMSPTDKLTWEERSNDLNKSIFYLINLKNDSAKMDLCLAYSQRNMTVYPPIIKGLARCLSTQYLNNKSIHQLNGKRGDRKKKDDPKSKDKDSDIDVTAGAHIGDITPPKQSTAPSGGASIGAHVLEANKQLSCPSYTLK